ncbi:hypothetical protein P3W53_14305 [Pseudomonas denitrificans (nom. rej.)]|nr:hypothetical protein [Pseudomonas denitrificans (nom. rej.)]
MTINICNITTLISEPFGKQAALWTGIVLSVTSGFYWLLRKIPGLFEDWGKVSRRHVSANKSLQDSAGPNSPLYEYFQQLIDIEAFHATTKIKAPWRTVVALGHLYQHGLLTHEDFIYISRKIKCTDDGIIKITDIPKTIFNLEIPQPFSWIAYGLGTTLWLFLFITLGDLGYLVGFCIFTLFMAVAIIITENTKALRIKKLNEEFEAYGIPKCSALIRHRQIRQSEAEPLLPAMADVEINSSSA